MMQPSQQALTGMRWYLKLLEIRRAERGGRRAPLIVMLLGAIEARAVLDFVDGKRVSIKTLVAEVVPEWASEATALRSIHASIAAGNLVVVSDPHDRRIKLVQPTDKLIATLNRRWDAVIASNRR